MTPGIIFFIYYLLSLLVEYQFYNAAHQATEKILEREFAVYDTTVFQVISIFLFLVCSPFVFFGRIATTLKYLFRRLTS